MASKTAARFLDYAPQQEALDQAIELGLRDADAGRMTPLDVVFNRILQRMPAAAPTTRTA